jgi:hypothetical protein
MENRGKSSNRKKIVKGLVIPKQWDRDGRVTDITIQSNKEESYLVAYNDNKRQLLNFIHQEIEAKGKITERLNGTVLMTVNSFRAVDAT